MAMASSTQIITLDNFASKLPPWSPDLPSHLYALVDMGSNGIRFSISDLSPPRSRLLKTLYRDRAAISLFDALNASSSSDSPSFPPHVIDQVSRALARFKAIAVEYRVPLNHISVFATEAMRKASNAAAMLDAIASASALSVQILAPEVEVLFGAMGARSGFAAAEGLFLDLGGGSIQMSYIDSSASDYTLRCAQTGQSLPFGAAKLLDILDRSDEEVRTAALYELSVGMCDAFSRLQDEFPKLRHSQRPGESGVDIYLCGGGFRGYGSILMHNDDVSPYPIPAVGAYTVNDSTFKQTSAMRKVNAEYNEKIYGMSKRRRAQFPAIATVVEALIGAVPNIQTATFCGGGNREGALLLKLPADIREADPLPLLHSKEVGLDSAVRTLQSALPPEIDFTHVPTIFTLRLGPLFVDEAWSNIGEPSQANAACQLHRSITRDPSVPGFTHLARSVLGLTLCHRWGGTLGSIDKQLFYSLKGLLKKAHPEANFWAEYIGAVAQLLADVCPLALQDSNRLPSLVKCKSQVRSGNKLQLIILLSSAIHRMVDPEIVASLFKGIGKSQDNAGHCLKRVEVLVQPMQASETSN